MSAMICICIWQHLLYSFLIICILIYDYIIRKNPISGIVWQIIWLLLFEIYFIMVRFKPISELRYQKSEICFSFQKFGGSYGLGIGNWCLGCRIFGVLGWFPIINTDYRDILLSNCWKLFDKTVQTLLFFVKNVTKLLKF